MNRRLQLALALSVLLHLALALWLLALPPQRREVPAPEALTFEVVAVEPVRAPAVADTPVGPSAPAPATAPKRGSPSPAVAAQTPSGAPAQPGAVAPSESDAPRESPNGTLALLPWAPSGTGSATANSGRGRTVRPGEEVPESLEVEGARVRGRVQEGAEDVLAERRVDNGLVDPFFHAVRHRMEAKIEAEPYVSSQRLKDAINDSIEGASKRYGRGEGVVEAPPSRTDVLRAGGIQHLREVDPGMGAFVESGLNGIELARRLEKEGAGAAKLVLQLELEQDTEGTVLSSQLLKSSGSAAYDHWVLTNVLGTLTLSATLKLDAGAAAHRSAWAFIGRLNPMLAPPQLRLPTLEHPALTFGTGFDETELLRRRREPKPAVAGAADRAQYSVDVKLLRVYR
jgi:hypothetical protein